jgi:hypothetical protein
MTAHPSPELLTAVGHNLLLTIAAGHSGPLQAAAGALDRLGRMLPDASPESRLTAVLLAISSEPTPRPVVAVQSPTPTPARRKDTTSQSDKQTRKSKASVPRMDASGKLIPHKEINGIAVISQAQARKVLGMNCPQVIKLENQRLLTRIQESGSRLVFYTIAEVQHLLDLIDATPPPPL